jgi:3-dehydroquinate dehydratase-2
MKLLVLNGPNLNLLGAREPDIYGNQTFHSYLKTLQRTFPKLEIDAFQSNQEGVLIDVLQKAAQKYEGVVLNAAGYTHTSVAIADAVAAVPIPVIEVHISNIYKRERFRHHSYIARYCKGTISGFGLNGYKLAILAMVDLLKSDKNS